MQKLLHYFCLGTMTLFMSLSVQARLTIAIDAGHGGKDPGAIGKNLGIKEKEVTLSIARELKALLDADPNFKAVMTRNGDYFIQLPDRTEIARKNRADYLVSIHADSSPNSDNLRGASVWVLSNRRANDELGKWLEDHEKQSELLGGAGSVLSSNQERYLNQTVLDLQFSHSQRSGYELGKTVLGKMRNITQLAKSAPQHASLSVLRSPDIPSILVETGFLSNVVEEQKLATKAYRRQVAQAIYQGLVEYRRKSPSQSSGAVYKEVKTEKKAENKETEAKSVKSNNASEKKTKQENSSTTKEKQTTKDKSKSAGEKNKTDVVNKKESTSKEAKENNETKSRKNTKEEKLDSKPEKVVNPNASFHVVQQDETLYSIARMYKTTPEKLSQLNNIKENKIVVGKKLKLK